MTSGLTEKRESRLVPATRMERIRELELIRRETRDELAAADENEEDILKAMVLASSMARLRALLDAETMQDVMSLQNCPLGFLTDQDPTKWDSRLNGGKGGYPKAYPVEVVRDCVIVAMLSGFKLTGNEFNIISARFYGAQAGYERLVKSWPGIQVDPPKLGIPQSMGETGALIEAVVTFRVGDRTRTLEFTKSGGPGDIDNRLTVRRNKGQGSDALKGKALRKVWKAVYETLTGCDPEAMLATIDVESQPVDEQEDGEGAVDQAAEPEEDAVDQRAAQIAAEGVAKMRELDQIGEVRSTRDAVLDVLDPMDVTEELLNELTMTIESAAEERIAAIRQSRGGKRR